MRHCAIAATAELFVDADEADRAIKLRMTGQRDEVAARRKRRGSGA